MRKLRYLIKRYERWLMIGLLLVVLVIFTVTKEITDWIAGRTRPGALLSDVAGSFAVLPGERVEVTWEEYDTARSRFRVAKRLRAGGQAEGVKDLEVWTHLLLLAAADREGVRVSNEELVQFLRGAGLGGLLDDRPRYREVVRSSFQMGLAEFEESVRDWLRTERLRDFYRDSYRVAPPDTREEMVKLYTAQNLEYARVGWAALDAARFLADAKAGLGAHADPQKALKEFFEKDPAVKADQSRFRHPRRYKFELLYTIHRNVLTDETYQRLEKVFAGTWPELDLSKLEETAAEMRTYYSVYHDRLLEQAGYAEGIDDPRLDGEEEAPEPKEGETEAEKQAREDALRRARRERGFEICRDQIDRELRIRSIYRWLHAKAREQEDKSLRELYEKMKAHDDPDHPVLTTEPQPAPKAGEPFDPNRPLIVYRRFDEPLSGEELEDLEDSGVRFTHNFRHRITSTGDKDLPKVGQLADVLGMSGHGRMVYRVLAVEPQRRKTFDELTPAEREELTEDFYLPHKAREKAEGALEALRGKIEAGEVKPESFPEAARSQGARVYPDEWVTATYTMLAEPEKSLFWASEFEHMRDRHFLRRQLAGVLGADRVKQEIGPGDFLEVQVNARSDSQDPGAAYLVQIHERQRPTAETMPEEEFATYARLARQRKDLEERQRWTDKPEVLISDFGMKFSEEMQKRIDEELERRRAAERRATQ